jgi:hypothetical protein
LMNFRTAKTLLAYMAMFLLLVVVLFGFTAFANYQRFTAFANYQQQQNTPTHDKCTQLYPVNGLSTPKPGNYTVSVNQFGYETWYLNP